MRPLFPSFLLLVVVKPATWRLPLLLPLPLFVVDEVLEFAELVFWLGGRWKIAPAWRVRAAAGVTGVVKMWRKTRRAGRFTLVDISSHGTQVRVQLF